MSRAITIGNGNLLVGIDSRGQVRDVYFPYVGHADHVSGASGSYVHRVGVFIGGTLKWLSDPSWEIGIDCDVRTTEHTISAYNSDLKVSLLIKDVVHNEKNVYLRKIILTNELDSEREIKLFFGQEFRISESRRGDTAFYDPRVNAVIHYKGHNAFLINAEIDGTPFSEYSVGIFDIEGKQGTYTDAEDGLLSKNPIEHGSTDSVIGLSFHADGKSSTAEIYYWLVAGTSIKEVHELFSYVKTETPQRLIASAERYWNAWTEKESRDFSYVGKEIENLYKRSLAIIRVHTDNRGGIIASSDTGILNQGRDTYGYVWPRDAAVSAHALDRGGYTDVTQRFFNFTARLLEHDGYLMHKYRVDGVLGSSWHPWIQNGKMELPIQEDETAIVLYMLYRHYRLARDLEYIESLYNPFVEPAADFMSGFIEDATDLPAGSYDLWEEKFGTSTYTACAVYGALTAASEFSALLGKRNNAQKYRDRALLLKQAILTHLYDPNGQMFVKLVRRINGKLEYDKTIDISSFHGLIFFDVLDPSDKRVTNFLKVVESKLKVPGAVGGYMRYEGDQYYKTGKDVSPNGWCITTLWMAQYYIRIAKKRADLARAYDILNWIQGYATTSGILPEQVHPITGEHLSTSPLVWSHAEFIITVDEYLKKMRELP